jgi:hypothetical protein
VEREISIPRSRVPRGYETHSVDRYRENAFSHAPFISKTLSMGLREHGGTLMW